jgi:protein-S-isoprenylcysteine O-methyltransferase Ste14
MRAFRHLLSILLLPFVVVAVVPRWLTTAWAGVDTRWASGPGPAWLARVAGAALLVLGVALVAWCVALFARVGQGTLAPWDPTRRLVAVGPYRHVRNPMIGGVAAMLAGEALLVGSRVLAGWAALFVLINHVYFLLSEEPGLERRFGSDYLAYRAAVPRWVPRITPWLGPVDAP